MKAVMILPPTALIGSAVAAAVGQVTGILTGQKSQWNIFLDLQANVIELDMRRYLIEHQIPGREGGINQDMGSASTRVMMKGKWIYENRPDVDIVDMVPFLNGSGIAWNWIRVQTMQLIYRLKQPLVISCDLITSMVLIEHMRFRSEGGKPNVYNYAMVLKEFNPALTLLGIVGSGVTNIIPSLVGGGGGL